MAVSIDVVNTWQYEEFTTRLGGVVEHFSILTAGLWSTIPFVNLTDLHAKLCKLMDQMPIEVKQGVLRVHPDLAGRLASESALTKESTNEQKTAGLLNLSQTEKTYLQTHNNSYKTKFHFPFIICARQNKKEAIMKGITERYSRSIEEETLQAFQEVKKIALFRLKDLIETNEQEFESIISKL